MTIAPGPLAPDPTQWRIVGTGDFDRDGKIDIVWQNQQDSGHLGAWTMDGAGHGVTSLTFTQPFGAISTTWKVVSVNDFNGDGSPDVLWQDTATGTVACWLMNGTAATTAGNITIASGAGAPDPSQWRIVGSGDFNNDGKPDILWQNQQDSGYLIVWFMNGTTRLNQQTITQPYGGIGVNWKVVGTGDYNADGQTDILWQNANNSGDMSAWLMNGTTLTQANNVAITQPFGAIATSWKAVGTR